MIATMQPELFTAEVEPQTGEYVMVALDAPLFGGYTYHVPPQFGSRFFPGQRVLVPLGKSNRKSVGFVLRKVPREQAAGRNIKSIVGVLDHRPLITPLIFDLAGRIADYYCCPVGTALAAVVPAAVKNRAGERKVKLASLPAEPGLPPKLSPKQQKVFDLLKSRPGPVRVTELAESAGGSPAIVRKLADLKLIELTEVRAWDLDEQFASDKPRASPGLYTGSLGLKERLTLNAEQQGALDTISARLDPPAFAVVLLYGVTGSGKTEVYLRAIEKVVAAGKQAIVLVPEISLTPQTQSRFSERFGSVAVLHSHMADTARHYEWRRIQTGQAAVVVGARSAVFAPCPRLGLIVVDEEHESSYKQSDGQPRYHARDVAVMRAQMEGCPVLLGSATPALETLQNCRTKPHYVRVDLTARVDSLPMPPVEIVDMKKEVRRRPGAHILSGELEESLRNAFGRGEQAILLLNRRGHSTFQLCPKCSYVAKCPHCDVAMVWHQTSQLAVCHYCRQTQVPPGLCPACGAAELKRFGAGTQRLEEELARLFPEIKSARMDGDTMSAAGAHDRTLKAFEKGELQLLFGTQMIAKGLHFPRVTVVGVISADTALAIPDFRAGERTFQMISQVAGRAGRSKLGGKVVVQTFEPDVSAIQLAAKHDYMTFADEELPQRRALAYPPYSRVVSFIVRDARRDKASDAAGVLHGRLQEIITAGALRVQFRGPVPAPIGKLSDQYRFLLLASSAGPGPLQAMLAEARKAKVFSEADIAVDVDPMAVL